MNADSLFQNILRKKSFLCVGLDSDIKRIPQSLHTSEDPVFEFNMRIIDATAEYTVAYKPNIAFYESRGAEGWKTLEKTAAYLKTNYPDIFLIADAKRGDIGNTSKMYANAFFENLPFDSVTVAPYMGEDSVSPFLSYKDKWVILLALTSNAGADDFQYIRNKENGSYLFEEVINKSKEWGTFDNMMFVAGATRADQLAEIRKLIPDHFLLVPGIGAQGGSLEEVVKYGMNDRCGLLVNSSRGIIFADNSEKFDLVAAEKAKELRDEMKAHLISVGLI